MMSANLTEILCRVYALGNNYKIKKVLIFSIKQYEY